MDDFRWSNKPDDSAPSFSVDDILSEYRADAAASAPAPAEETPAFTGLGPEKSPETPDEANLQSAPVEDGVAYEPDEDSAYEAEDASPARRRRAASPARKKGVFSFLSGKKAAGRTYDIPEEEDGSVPEESALSEAEEPDTAFHARTPGETDYSTDAHSGALGQMEKEARSYIAQLQAKSGAASRRERQRAAAHTVDLDTMLRIEADGDRPDRAQALEGEAALAAAASKGYSAGVDYDYDEREPDADPTQYSEDRQRYRPDTDRDGEIDSRFNLSGRRQRENISYGGSEVDLSADEAYTPARQTGYNPSQWTPDYDDPLAEKNEELEPPRKRHKLFGRARQARAQRERAKRDKAAAVQRQADDTAEKPVVTYSVFDDEDAAPSDYAPAGDYEEDEGFPDEGEEDGEDERGAERYRESDLYMPPSFREYVLSLMASFWLRLRGTARGRTAETMPDTEENLGPEPTPAEASKYYGSLLRSMKLRVRIALALLVILCYVSLEAPVPGMLRTLPVMAMFCFGLQAAICLLALDVLTNGVLNIFRRRVGADSLAVLACLFTGLDALNVGLSETAALHMPLCAISSCVMFGLLLAAYLSARGLRKAIRVPAIGKRFYAVTAEEKLAPGEITLLKSLRSARGFVHRAEEAGPDETLYTKISLPLLVLAILLTIIIMVVKKSYTELLYIFSALLSMTVPFGAMLSFSLPFFLGSTRIFRFGAAIAGWSGLCDIGASKNLIVTDRDLFPENTITIDSVRIFADEDAQKVISYAGTIMGASGCCSAACFADLMKETNSPMRTVDGFEFLPGGGMKGIIDGHVVLCGSTDLMRLMNVRIPFRLTDKTTVLLAIDGILYGIFSLKYEGLPNIRRALVDLMRSARPPVFAVRDFNITPEMLHNTFDLATDGYDFPPFADRFKLSEPAQDIRNERITAILCNEGLAPLTNAADIGRSMYMSTRINLWLNLLAAVLGILLVFVRLVGVGSCPLSTLFFFGLLWSLLVGAVSAFVAAKR